MEVWGLGFVGFGADKAAGNLLHTGCKPLARARARNASRSRHALSLTLGGSWALLLNPLSPLRGF